MYICVCDLGTKNPLGNVGGSGSILDWEDPLQKGEWQPTPVSCSGKCYGQRILAQLQSMALQRIRYDLVTRSHMLVMSPVPLRETAKWQQQVNWG